MLKAFFFVVFTAVLPLINAEINCSDDTEKLLEAGNAAFTGRFLYEATKSEPNKNLIMSPYSVFTPFAQLALYSQGETKDQLMKVLNLSNKDDIRCIFPKLTSQLRAQREVVLNIASKIYSTDLYPLSTEFQDDTKAVFDSEADTIDIGDPEGSAAKINQWVEDQTNARIKDIATPDMIDEDTRLVLANAIYFLGNWTRVFRKSNTIDRTFYLNNKDTVEIPTMYQRNSFKYGESSDLDCKVLVMPYKGGNFSLVAFLPNEIEGLFTLVDNLQDPSKFYKAFDETRNEQVDVFIPKFKIESQHDLKIIMEKVGIVDVLNQNKSNLTGILEKYEPLYVTAAKQKAFIDLNEAGTEAAAANIVVISALSSFIGPTPRVYVFKADRPFAYYIMHKNFPIFAGSFVTN